MSKCTNITVEITARPAPEPMKGYLAGKITGDQDYRLKFLKARQKLERDGYLVISPAVLPDRLTSADYRNAVPGRRCDRGRRPAQRDLRGRYDRGSPEP